MKIKPISKREVDNLKWYEKRPPEFIYGNCLMCGNCCEGVGCENFDKKTRKCKIYKNRPEGCRTFPNNLKTIIVYDCKGFKSKRT